MFNDVDMRDIAREDKESGEVMTRYGRVKVQKDETKKLSERRFSVRISTTQPDAWKIALADLQALARKVEKYAEVTLCGKSGDIIFSMPVAQKGRGHATVIARAITFVGRIRDHYGHVDVPDEGASKPKKRKPTKTERDTYFNGKGTRVWDSAAWRANRQRMANKTA